MTVSRRGAARMRTGLCGGWCSAHRLGEGKQSRNLWTVPPVAVDGAAKLLSGCGVLVVSHDLKVARNTRCRLGVSGGSRCILRPPGRPRRGQERLYVALTPYRGRGQFLHRGGELRVL